MDQTSRPPNTQPTGIPGYDRELARNRELEPRQRPGAELEREEPAFYRLMYRTPGGGVIPIGLDWEHQFDQLDTNWGQVDIPSSHGSLFLAHIVVAAPFVAELSFDNFGPPYSVLGILEFSAVTTGTSMEVVFNEHRYPIVQDASTLKFDVGTGRNRIRIYREVTTAMKFNLLVSLWRYRSGRFVHPDRITL